VLELFVYYRVDAAHAAEAKAAVQRWQHDLDSAYPELHGRLLKRPQTRDGLQTWMETYTHSKAATGVSQLQLQTLLPAGPAELRRWLHGDRHLEVFVPCA